MLQTLITLPLLAETDSVIRADALLHSIVNAVTYSVIGLGILALAIVFMSKLMPLPFWKEIEEDQNIALGIMVGSIILGISVIIAAAIHG
jgi:putative membrane protein